MKKWILLLLASLSILLMGCTSMEVKAHKTFIKTSNLVDLDATKGFRGNDLKVKIINKTDDFVEVIWDSTNINDMPVGFGDDLVIQVGQKKANTSIAPKDTFEKEIFTREIFNYPVKVYVKVKQGTKEEFVALKLEDKGEKVKVDFNFLTGETKIID